MCRVFASLLGCFDREVKAKWRLRPQTCSDVSVHIILRVRSSASANQPQVSTYYNSHIFQLFPIISCKKLQLKKFNIKSDHAQFIFTQYMVSLHQAWRNSSRRDQRRRHILKRQAPNSTSGELLRTVLADSVSFRLGREFRALFLVPGKEYAPGGGRGEHEIEPGRWKVDVHTWVLKCCGRLFETEMGWDF